MKRLFQNLLIILSAAAGFAWTADVEQKPTAYFDGETLIGFDNTGKWPIAHGAIAMSAARKTGRLTSTDSFDDVHLHVEWKRADPSLTSQDGNSGLFFGPYEVQVFDSFRRKARSPDSQACAIYGQFPPYVNASRPPDEWTTVDVLFHNARFDAAGNVLSPARMTVVHNGVFVHHDRVLVGEKQSRSEEGKTIFYNAYKPHGREKISFQEHGSSISFRNIRIIETGAVPDDPRMVKLDLARLEAARKTPAVTPYTKGVAEPPVVAPANAQTDRPSDAEAIQSRTGEWKTDGPNGQLHLEWTGTDPLRVDVLGEQVSLVGTNPEKNTADIAFTADSIDGTSWVCITTLIDGRMEQRRKVKDVGPTREVRMDRSGRITSAWMRNLEGNH